MVLLYLISLFSQIHFNDPPQDSLRYLALGDSYTVGESLAGSERFPVQLAKELSSRGIPSGTPRIIATTGWTTSDLMKAMDAQDVDAERFDLVSLLIGVNDQYQGKDISLYPANFRRLLQRSIRLTGGDTSRVFVLSIPDYAYTPFGQGRDAEKISSEIDAYNQINKEIATELGVLYFDITPISRKGLKNPDWVASDQLHPSALMYQEWVKLISNVLVPKLKSGK